MNIFKYQSRNKGFTLVELLVVISIVSLLSSVVLSNVRSSTIKARDTRRFAELRQVAIALELYFNANGSYPNYGDPTMDVNWGNMLGDLIAGKFLGSSQGLEYRNPLAFFDGFSLINTANAMLAGPTNIRPQDPLYPAVSYGYMPTNDFQNYRIRIKLENISSPLLNSGVSGNFLDLTNTGVNSCDKTLGYYCRGQSTGFIPYGY